LLLALFVFILWIGWQQLAALSLSTDEEIGKSHGLKGCIAAVCAHLTGNLFLFEVTATAVVFWLLLAIITAAAIKSNPQKIELPTSRWLRMVLMIAMLVVVGWLTWLGSVRPLMADLHSWRGTHALNRGNSTAALVEYQTAVKYQPQRVDYLVAVSLTAAQLGDFEQAEQAINQAITRHPIDPVLYTHLAAIHGRQMFITQNPEDLALAYRAYEQAIALAPTIGLTYQQYADLALRSGDAQTAVRQAQQATTLDTTDGLAFGILGWSQLQTGNLSAAEKAFVQAVRWQPNSADFHLGLATVYFQQDEFEAARQAVRQSLLLDPEYEPALTLQLQLQDK
jgi:Flp pilus assembly protein TadD